MEVQVLLPAPKKNRTPIGVLFFFCVCTRLAEPHRRFRFCLQNADKVSKKTAPRRNGFPSCSNLRRARVESSSPFTGHQSVSCSFFACVRVSQNPTAVFGFAEGEMPTSSRQEKSTVPKWRPPLFRTAEGACGAFKSSYPHNKTALEMNYKSNAVKLI